MLFSLFFIFIYLFFWTYGFPHMQEVTISFIFTVVTTMSWGVVGIRGVNSSCIRSSKFLTLVDVQWYPVCTIKITS